jgi:ribosomal protein S27AE
VFLIASIRQYGITDSPGVFESVPSVSRECPVCVPAPFGVFLPAHKWASPGVFLRAHKRQVITGACARCVEQQQQQHERELAAAQVCNESRSSHHATTSARLQSLQGIQGPLQLFARRSVRAL